MLKHNVGSDSGVSGAPIFSYEKSNATIIAVHNFSPNKMESNIGVYLSN